MKFENTTAHWVKYSTPQCTWCDKWLITAKSKCAG